MNDWALVNAEQLLITPRLIKSQKGIALSVDYVSHHLARMSSGVIVILAVVMVTSLLIGIFFRYVLDAAPSWTGELAILTFSWIIFLASSIGVREGFHVRITLLHNSFSGKINHYIHDFILLLVLASGLALIITGYQFMDLALGQVSPAIGYPMWIFNVSLPVSGALMMLHACARLVMAKGLD